MLQNKGNVKYENTYINNFNNGGDRYDNCVSYTNSSFEVQNEDLSISDEYFNFNNGGESMENLNELLTVIGSAIAGVYCAVKSVIAFIKKIKG